MKRLSMHMAWHCRAYANTPKGEEQIVWALSGMVLMLVSIAGMFALDVVLK